MREYFLTTERLGFSFWTDEDLHCAVTLRGDSEVTRFIVSGGSMNAEEVERRLCREMESQRVSGVQYWPLFLKGTGQFVGCCGLRTFGDEHEHLEMGVHLCRENWGKGMATEACRAVIGYAFDSLKAECMFAGHHPLNNRSQKMLVGLGFRYVKDVLYPPTGLMHPSYRMDRK